MSENLIYGVDLGTTNSAVALKGELITELLPSIASLTKRDAGGEYKEDLKATRSFKVDMTIHKEGNVPIIASGLVMQRLVKEAREAGHEVKDVVISVPAYFRENQRAATVKAAEAIKLNVRGIINEPTAAAIAIAKEYKGLFVIYDLGGGTFDISVIDSRFGIFEVIANDGTRIGGDDIDQAIVDYLYKEVAFRRHKFSREDEYLLLLMAEKAKLHISKTGTPYTFNFNGLPMLDEVNIDKSTDRNYELTPSIYDMIMRRVLKETVVRTRTVIDKRIADDDFKLALVGGSTKCPYVTRYVEEYIGKQADKFEYNPDTIVAEGASIYAEMVRTGENVKLVQDVTKGIGVMQANGTIKNIIPDNSKIPISRSSIFTTLRNSNVIEIQVYQGSSVLAKNNDMLGTFRYELSRDYKGSELSATLTVEVTLDGLVNVTVKEPLKAAKTVAMERNGKSPAKES